jgi:hypothetical protein|tara:strand:- start:1114 stop:1410 length:297 start_codon:yes stop_codon:yes gene_type:complete
VKEKFQQYSVTIYSVAASLVIIVSIVGGVGSVYLDKSLMERDVVIDDRLDTLTEVVVINSNNAKHNQQMDLARQEINIKAHDRIHKKLDQILEKVNEL